MNNLTHGSLFSGIGGFDLAAENAGFKNTFHCEFDLWNQQLLKYYWPDAHSHTDIKTTDFKQYEHTIDVISGGFPCQPFSTAGKRKGTNDDRYLWPEMLRAIQEIKPTWIIAENVHGIINIGSGLVFQNICLSLETEGYEVQPFIIPAAGKNAIHKRDRIWIIAYNNNHRCRRIRKPDEKAGPQKSNNIFTSQPGVQDEKLPANTINPRSRKKYQEIQAKQTEWLNSSIDKPVLANTNHQRSQEQPTNTITTNKGQFKRTYKKNWHITWPSEPAICGPNDGIPEGLDTKTFHTWRRKSIKAYGNAIVPQVAYEFFYWIHHIESTM